MPSLPSAPSLQQDSGAENSNSLRGHLPGADQILAVAHESVVAKGFDATSVEEIAAAVEISRAGFFYHFPDKNALALALVERHAAFENRLMAELMARAAELSDDPLQRLLILVRLYAELFADMPNGYPGCIVASAAYQDRLFDARVKNANRQAVLAWRGQMKLLLEEVVAVYPPREPVDLTALADMMNTVVEGGLVMSRALGEPHMIVGQVLLLRQYLKLLFTRPDRMQTVDARVSGAKSRRSRRTERESVRRKKQRT
jgi:AcrR family transcriptional regulator